MNNNFYVYLHNRKSDGTPFYVGKGCGKRAWSFSKRNNHWNAVASKHGVEVEILFWANAPLVYSYWIRGATPKQLSRIFKDFKSSAFVKLTEEFKLGFVPMENKGWLNQFKEPPKKLNENPFALLKKVHKFDVYMRAEEVFSLYKEGKGSKAIAKIIGCDYQNLTGILLKFEKGWSPLDDEVFSFIKTRAMVENLDE